MSFDKSGFLLINKPKNITSYACINHIKRLIGKQIKIGHAGTLDPFATGLLIIAIGRVATREINWFSKINKMYKAQGKLGELTDTLDCTGTVIQVISPDSISQSNIVQAIEKFGSSYTQIPPIYSALKYKGEPLYKLARQAKYSFQEFEQILKTKEKKVYLFTFELQKFERPFFVVEACVSHGTYIRSLVNDLAQQFNNCATTYALERIAIGPIFIDEAYDLDVLSTINDVKRLLIPVESMRQRLKNYQVNEENLI